MAVTVIDLTRLKHGESGVIKAIDEGSEIRRKVRNMGLITGKRVKKISSHFWRGPQTIEVGHARIAIGFGMAKKIHVEVER